MNNTRLTFHTSTNFTLPIGAFYILRQDAHYYGYIKNNTENISGFLNDLIPALSDYQDDLYNNLLKYNNGNADMAKAVARNIHNVYLRPFTFHDDGVVNIPFRISKDKYDTFLSIHDDRLAFYDTNFTSYIRTILVEYTSKTFAQREYLYAFSKLKPLREAILKNHVCRIYHHNERSTFIPVSVETSPIYDHNFIVGITSELQPIAIRLCDFQKITVLEERITVTQEMCDLIEEYLHKIYSEEHKECLG